MKATHALIRSDRFPCVQSEDPDRDPPPGREFAQALLDAFADNGASPRKPKVEDRDWEHSTWFFWVVWQENEFRIDLELSPHDTIPPTWHFGIARVRGVFRALFGGRQGRFDVPDGFLHLAGEVLRRTAECETVTWITEDQAVDALWGRPAPPHK
jgi:hypothetical protein